MQTRHKAAQIVGIVLIFFAGLVLIGSAVAKFARVPMVVTEMGAVGFVGIRLTLIAVLEISSAILFLVPATRSIGFPLVSAYMGGAIATHLGHAHSPSQPVFLLALIWLGTWLRHPEILWRTRTEGSQLTSDAGQTQTANRQVI